MLHNLLLDLVHVDVAAHKIGKERTFGKPASDLWKRHMQTAEGPNAFKKGYHKLMEHFCDGSYSNCIAKRTDITSPGRSVVTVLCACVRLCFGGITIPP